MTVLASRIEFVLLFDVTNGNPNGDPDMGNMPRTDPETHRGLITDVCLKRKLRNYVGITRDNKPPYEIYVRERAVLNLQHKRAYDETGFKAPPRRLPKDEDEAQAVTQWMCRNFYDVRTFGAVMSTEINAGHVRGPVQLGFARSEDPVQVVNVSISRMAVTTERESIQQGGLNRTMGEKWIVPYGLYRCHGFISAHLAARSGFSEDDLALLWEGLLNMFDHDHSATRAEMACRRLYVFRHSSALGNAPAHALFEIIQISKTIGVEEPPRRFFDYEVLAYKGALPAGVTLEVYDP